MEQPIRLVNPLSSILLDHKVGCAHFLVLDFCQELGIVHPSSPEKQTARTGLPVAPKAERQAREAGRLVRVVLPLLHSLRRTPRETVREVPGCRQRTARAGHAVSRVARQASKAGVHVSGGGCRTKTLRGRLQARRRGLRSPRRRAPWQVPGPPEGSLTTESSNCRGPARGRQAPGLSCRAGGAECVFLSPARAPLLPEQERVGAPSPAKQGWDGEGSSCRADLGVALRRGLSYNPSSARRPRRQRHVQP
jgi:hypothetical protein